MSGEAAEAAVDIYKELKDVNVQESDLASGNSRRRLHCLTSVIFHSGLLNLRRMRPNTAESLCRGSGPLPQLGHKRPVILHNFNSAATVSLKVGTCHTLTTKTLGDSSEKVTERRREGAAANYVRS